jgi:polar amino acid transport system substrate-binding protein
MSKILISAAIIMVATAILVACAFLSVQPVEKKTIVISGHPDWKPFMYQNGDDISGVGVEVTTSVFKDLNINVIPKYEGSWEVVQEKALTGEVGAIVAMYKTKEREEKYCFSIPYASDPVALFIKGNNFTYNKKEDLIGKKGLAMMGDSYGQEMDDFIVQKNLDITRTATPQGSFSLLDKGEADYFLYSAYAGRRVIEESNLSGFEEAGIASNQLFYIAVSKKLPCDKYMNSINLSLQKMISENKIPSY